MEEPDDFKEFVLTCSPSLLSFAWVLTGERAAAEDLVQTALLKMWRNWDGIASRDNPIAYARRVLATTRTTWLRRRWNAERPTEQLPDLPGHDAFAACDEREALRRALLTLPPRQRAVVALRYLEDLPEAEVADLLGCSVGTVKSQASKALARLREQLPLHDVIGREEAR